MYSVPTMGTKDNRINFRIKLDLKDDLKVVAEIRGLGVSQLLHTLIVKAIQEERKADPVEFERVRKKLHKGHKDASNPLRKVS